MEIFQPHDNLEQRSRDMRCALHVVARAWQVSNGEHLSKVVDRKSFDQITAYIPSSTISGRQSYFVWGRYHSQRTISVGVRACAL